jgi:hypothetical protein
LNIVMFIQVRNYSSCVEPVIVIHLPLVQHAGFQNLFKEMNLRDSCLSRVLAMEL